MWTNNMVKMPQFSPSIDNLTYTIKETRNCMIGPVYKHLEEWEDAESQRQPIAIFQFINKKDYSIITDFDVVS